MEDPAAKGGDPAMEGQDGAGRDVQVARRILVSTLDPKHLLVISVILGLQRLCLHKARPFVNVSRSLPAFLPNFPDSFVICEER